MSYVEMSKQANRSIHASAIVCGNTGILIRGPSGSGKSQLAFDLILAGRAGQVPPATLVGDDRVHVEARNNAVVVRPADGLKGLIEIRGLGIRRCEFAGEAEVRLVVDLAAPDGERLPAYDALMTGLCGVRLPRLPVAAGYRPLPIVLAALTTEAVSGTASLAGQPLSDDCQQAFGNHIRPMIAT